MASKLTEIGILTHMIKDKQPKTATEASVQAKATEPKKSSFDWLGTVFKLSALFLFGIYLYGYGAAVGYAGYFGIPQSALYSSSTDLLGIASETLLHQVLGLLNAGDVYFHLWSFLKSIFSVILFIGLGVWFVSFAAVSLSKNKQIPVFSNKSKNFLFPDTKSLSNESTSTTAIRAIWHGILAILASLIGQSVVFIAIFISLAFISLAAIVGYFAALNHAELDIIRPTKCDPILTRIEFIDTLEKQKVTRSAGIKDAPALHTANCVKVTFSDDKGSKTIAGRSVIAGSDYILVYEMSGKTTRIPIKTAVIQAANDAVLSEVELQNSKLPSVKAQ